VPRIETIKQILYDLMELKFRMISLLFYQACRGSSGTENDGDAPTGLTPRHITLVRMKMTRRPDGPPPASISLSRARYSASSRTAIRIGPPLGVCRSVSSSMRDLMRLMVFRVAIAHAFPSCAFQLV
jgi:hypothetical protein